MTKEIQIPSSRATTNRGKRSQVAAKVAESAEGKKPFYSDNHPIAGRIDKSITYLVISMILYNIAEEARS